MLYLGPRGTHRHDGRLNLQHPLAHDLRLLWGGGRGRTEVVDGRVPIWSTDESQGGREGASLHGGASSLATGVINEYVAFSSDPRLRVTLPFTLVWIGKYWGGEGWAAFAAHTYDAVGDGGTGGDPYHSYAIVRDGSTHSMLAWVGTGTGAWAETSTLATDIERDICLALIANGSTLRLRRRYLDGTKAVGEVSTALTANPAYAATPGDFRIGRDEYIDRLTVDVSVVALAARAWSDTEIDEFADRPFDLITR